MKNFLSILRSPGWKRLLWVPLLCLLLAVSGCSQKSADSPAQTAQQSSAVSEGHEETEPADSGGESSLDESDSGEPPDTQESAPELQLLTGAGDQTSGDGTSGNGDPAYDGQLTGTGDQAYDGQLTGTGDQAYDGQLTGTGDQAYDGQFSGDDGQPSEETDSGYNGWADNELLPEDGSYTTADDVALYLHTYGRLPNNFMTKKEAKKLGWSGGSLEDYAPGMCIGGDYFGNYEGNLPDGNYRECDINTLGKKKRGAERLIFSDDGRIYYTNNHYKSFTLLYGEE